MGTPAQVRVYYRTYPLLSTPSFLLFAGGFNTVLRVANLPSPLTVANLQV
jgi:hypothetical protein